MSKQITQAELQHIEYTNKILNEHLELVERVTERTQKLLNDYLPILQNYMQGVVAVRNEMGKEVNHIVQSTRQISIVTSNTQKLMDFTTAVVKLEAVLTPSLIDKLERLVAK